MNGEPFCRVPARACAQDATSVGSTRTRTGRAQNYLDSDHTDQIVTWVHGFKDVRDRVKVIDLRDIEAEDWTLNISRYVLPPAAEDLLPLPKAVSAFKAALAEARSAEERLAEILREGGWLE